MGSLIIPTLFLVLSAFCWGAAVGGGDRGAKQGFSVATLIAILWFASSAYRTFV